MNLRENIRMNTIGKRNLEENDECSLEVMGDYLTCPCLILVKVINRLIYCRAKPPR